MNLARLWSRFATPRSEEARLDAVTDDSALAGVDESDPASMARWIKRMGNGMGEESMDAFEQTLDEEMAVSGGDADRRDDHDE